MNKFITLFASPLLTPLTEKIGFSLLSNLSGFHFQPLVLGTFLATRLKISVFSTHERICSLYFPVFDKLHWIALVSYFKAL